MPKRKPKAKSSASSATRLAILGASAVAVFLFGEALLLTRSDSGQLALARYSPFVDEAQVTRLVGRQLRRGLDAVGIPSDSIAETVAIAGPARVRWRVGLRPGASLLQANYAVTRSLEKEGGVVLSGRESWSGGGAAMLTLLVGLGSRPTHQLVFVREPRPETESERESARLAIVLYGFGDRGAEADSFVSLPAPFALALVPGANGSEAAFRAAHGHHREVVLHLPLEPINYPQINPGPGTVLVTMKPARIADLVRHYVDQAAPVAAVANHMGSLATQDMSVMSAIFRELRRSNLPFLHVNPAPGAVCKALAGDAGVVYDEPDAVLDAETRADDSRALERRWKQVLVETRARGHAVVLIRATPLTRRWLANALDRKRLEGVDVVPLSALLRPPVAL